MRFPKKKVSTRATALALVLGVVGVLVTALPAWAAVPVTGTFSPTVGPPGTAVIVSTGFRVPERRNADRDDSMESAARTRFERHRRERHHN